jgi:hypothetical protein
VREVRPKAALRPHAACSGSATSVPGTKPPRHGPLGTRKVPNATPASPADTSEKCLDLPTERQGSLDKEEVM